MKRIIFYSWHFFLARIKKKKLSCVLFHFHFKVAFIVFSRKLPLVISLEKIKIIKLTISVSANIYIYRKVLSLFFEHFS